MRALSPGINDPVTAITAMNWLGAGIGLLGQREPLSPCGWMMRTSQGLFADDWAARTFTCKPWLDCPLCRAECGCRAHISVCWTKYVAVLMNALFPIWKNSVRRSRSWLNSPVRAGLLKTLARITEGKEGGEAGWRKRLRQTVLRK